MTAKIPTTEKILAETLELHEKGVSLHSIVRTYPEHSVEIEELFAAMATLSLEKEKIVVPKGGLERLLASLPTTEPVAPRAAQIKSPFSTFMSSIQLSTLKFVLPIAAACRDDSRDGHDARRYCSDDSARGNDRRESGLIGDDRTERRSSDEQGHGYADEPY